MTSTNDTRKVTGGEAEADTRVTGEADAGVTVTTGKSPAVADSTLWLFSRVSL